jgi:hypothetical protein
VAPVNLLRTLAVLALVAVGAFFFFEGALGYSSGFAYEGTGISLIAAFSILCLVGAAFLVLRSFGTSAEDSNASQTYGAVYLGLFLAFAAQFIPFPVGCNLDAWPYNLTNVFHGCPASPEGVWSTIWPNALATCIGTTLATSGYGKIRRREGALPGLGLGLTISGFLLLVWGFSIGYFTSCPANGCPPLTGSQWWSLFWPDVVAESLGAVCIVIGSTMTVTHWRSKGRQLAPGDLGREAACGVGVREGKQSP